MATTYYTDIQKLYVAYFNRPADPSGLAFWETAVEGAKGSTAAVAAEFAKSAEYTAGFSGMTNAQIVNQVYTNLFGRGTTGDAGADFWINGLDNKVITVADVVTAVAAGAQGSDLTSFNNKVKASAAFTAALDTDAEKAGYAGVEANAIAKAFLAGITTDATYAAATTPAQLNTTVASAVAAGTTFTVTGALSSLNAANAAMKSFLAAADGDNDSTTSTTKVKLDAAVTTATTSLTGLFTDGRDAAFSATTSASVKSALIGDQTAAYATKIAAAQSTVATDTQAVDKVVGLTAAVAARDAAQATVDTATKAQTAAAADLAAKVASYNVNHAAATITVDATTGIASIGGTAVFTTDSSGKLVLSTGITETTNSGITAILNASNTKESADLTVDSATKVLTAATNEVNHLDFAAGSAEVTSLAAIQTAMGATTSPTEAQITTYLTTLKTAADATGATADQIKAYTDFNALVTTYHTDAAANPAVDKLDASTEILDGLTTNSTKFNAAAASLNSSQSLVDQYAGYKATVDAATKAFVDAGYNLVDLTATGASATQVASTLSDVYVVGKADTTISLFGLQGKDAISIGSGYTLNTGKLSAGDDTKLEVFVAQAANGTDTTLKIEAHAFSSHVTSAAAPELVTITLVGVNAANVHLDANGIITVG